MSFCGTARCQQLLCESGGRPLTSFKRNQFGFSLGGPVHDSENLQRAKIERFSSRLYEGQRILAASLAQHTLPTDLERSGRFHAEPDLCRPDESDLRSSHHSPQPGPARPVHPRSVPGNIIPIDRLDPVALKAQRYYPAPNGPGLPFTSRIISSRRPPISQPQDRIEFKIDHNFNDRQRIFGRYTYHGQLV